MASYPGIESSTLEFKREIPQYEQIVKTAIAFCNSHGGKIVIGVTDDGHIIGLNSEDIESIILKIEETIFDSCYPHLIPKVYLQTFVEKSVLIIEVNEGMNKPYYRRSTGKDKGTFIRLGHRTVPATPSIIRELQWEATGIDYERTPVYEATVDDLQREKIQNFLDGRKNQGIIELGESVLQSYNLIAYDQAKKYPSVAGILLFSNKPQIFISEAMIICSHFAGISGREALASVDCEGTLFDQFKQAFNFILSRLYRSFTIKSIKREEKLEIPEIAIREALLNVLVHRNYHIKAPAKIAVYDDRVEFHSPGGFPGPYHENSMRSGITYLRNPAICKIFREANYIEKLGTGFINILNSYEEYGLPTPEVLADDDRVKCILPRSSYNATSSNRDEHTKILDLFKMYDEISVRDVEICLGVSSSTALRRLNELLVDGVIERFGQKRSSGYKLKKNQPC